MKKKQTKKQTLYGENEKQSKQEKYASDPSSSICLPN